MAVTLTVSETLTGAEASDVFLDGGDPGTYTGIDLGQVVNNSYAPLADKSLNTGHQDVFLHHDGTNEITDVKFFLGDYAIQTGNPYGGGDSSAADIAQMISLGNASGSSKNNADGLSGGIWMDMDWDASTTNQFDQANFPSVVKIFGDNNTDGIDAASGFLLSDQAMVYDDTGSEVAATTPEAGKIGAIGDTVLGDNAHLKFRVYMPNAFTEGGYYQVALVTLFTFTD